MLLAHFRIFPVRLTVAMSSADNSAVVEAEMTAQQVYSGALDMLKVIQAGLQAAQEDRQAALLQRQIAEGMRDELADIRYQLVNANPAEVRLRRLEPKADGFKRDKKDPVGTTQVKKVWRPSDPTESTASDLRLTDHSYGSGTATDQSSLEDIRSKKKVTKEGEAKKNRKGK